MPLRRLGGYMQTAEEREEVRESIIREIFDICKSENRQPDECEILILQNLEDQRFTDRLFRSEIFREAGQRGKSHITATQTIESLKG